MINLLIMGKPGAGKGTQATKLLRHFNLYHISTGNIYRNEIKKNSEIGKEAMKYLAQGNLVPDKMTNDIVSELLSNKDYLNGFMLDGYPRTEAQAEALDIMLKKLNIKLTAVVNVEVADTVLLHRMAGRRVCSNCGHTYHVDYHPPVVKGICNHCGSELIQRDDDLEESVMNRLDIYNKKTRPLLEHYRRSGLLSVIDGEQSSNKVFKDIIESIGE